ncbi:MAG: molybdopterin dinucleotide binding domain-containing protein [candidate division WOR-3 bacterium]
MKTVRKFVCDFCLNGCNIGILFDGYQYRIEYLTEEPPNYGRLCPRGNSASIVIDHPKRLCYPLLDGKEITWQQALNTIQQWLDECSGRERAVVYSRGLSPAEAATVAGFARQLGTENLVCGYLEPDNFLGVQLAGVRRAKLEEVQSARAILLVGDVFSASPVAAKFILDARYAERNSRLVVIDSIRTRQSGFAQLFLLVKPGTEYRALAAIAGILDPKLELDVDRFAVECGVERSRLEEAAAILKSTPAGLVGAAASFGRVANPLLHSLCAQLVALKTDKPFAGFAEALIPNGRLSFQQFQEKVVQGQIKMIFWFGGLFPYSYPEVFPALSQVRFRVATTIFRLSSPLPGLVLPVVSEFEKSGSGETLWRQVSREPVVRPVSGSRLISEIIQGITGSTATESLNVPVPVQVDKLLEWLAGSRKPEPVSGYLLVGERRAIGIGEFYDSEEEITVNPADARQLGVKDEELVTVKSRTAEEQFRVKVSGAVPAGVLVVGVDAHRNRRLFSVEFDEPGGIATIPPTKVEVWRTQG